MPDSEVKHTNLYQLRNAKEFFEAISPIGNILPGISPKDRWIFRGESSDVRFDPLVPSVLRADNREKLVNLSRIAADRLEDPVTEWRIVCAEILLLQKFFNEADRAGLQLPEDRQGIRSYLQDPDRSLEYFTKNSRPWPPNELLSLMSLAQHHELPTRLLDWTRNHLVAAYFAARDVLRSLREGENLPVDENLVVWAANETKFYSMERQFLESVMGPLLLITAPAALNQNLQAQQGLFTLWRRVGMYEDPVDRSPLNQRLAEWPNYALDDEDVVFIQFKLPQTEARELFQSLLSLGITAGRLFPGFQGAAESLRDFSLAYE